MRGIDEPGNWLSTGATASAPPVLSLEREMVADYGGFHDCAARLAQRLRDNGVTEASVVGPPHPDWGEIVVAFVVGDAQWPDPDRLCVDNIARFTRPKRYLRLLELP